MKKFHILAAGFALFGAISSMEAAKPGWGENFEAAKKEAADSKKHIFLDFTGSDWCGWCIKIDKDVFAKDDFKGFAKDNLVLVEVDFPNGKQLPKEVSKQNEALKGQFKVGGFPTLVLLDSGGKEVKRWEGYSPTLLSELRKAVGK